MAKSGFDDTVPRVRPRLRLGGVEGEMFATEPPPVREPADGGAAQALDALVALVDAFDPPSADAAVTPAQDVLAATQPQADGDPIAPIDDAVANAAPDEAPVAIEARRAALKREAAGLAHAEPLVVEAAAIAAPTPLDELDALADAAALAGELERALAEAADTNEALRGDLGVALDDLARTMAEGRRLTERIGRLEAEGRERARVVHDLLRELELLEGERDAALTQSATAALEAERSDERLRAVERRAGELERQLLEARARTQRFEEAAAAQVAQRTALRAELEVVRRERDDLLAAQARLERERDDSARSRRALDEVHRALSEARQRAQRLRPR